MTQYAELHAHSYFSLLDGTSEPAELIRRASEVGIRALALTDHDAVYGVIPFAKAAKRNGIHPILGAEITIEDRGHLTLLVKDKRGWENLCYLITCARHNAPKGQAALPLKEVEHHTEGLVALSGCRVGEIARAIFKKDYTTAESAARRYKAWFGADFWIELQHHLLPTDNTLRRDLVALATHLNLGMLQPIMCITPHRINMLCKMF